LTGKATTAEIKKAVKKETTKALKAPVVIAKKKPGKNIPASIAAGSSPTLKISFNTADLKKTTPKEVYTQVNYLRRIMFPH
jgi:hypothetical protein